ncbi:MAG: helix-turn-helix domain-containing protein [Blastocatellales bacterium]
MDKEFEVRDLRTKQFFQIDDEYLNGYARLCGINATGVYLSLCRHADREQKCFPSKRLMADELDISERSVYNALKTLEEWGVIRVVQQGRKDDGSYQNNTYYLLDKSNWRPKSVKQSEPQANSADGKIRQSPQANDDTSRGHVVPNKDTHIKDTHIEVNTSAAKPPDEINELLDFFRKTVNPHINFANKTERKACKDLLDTYGAEKTKQAIVFLEGKRKTDKYLPTVTTPYELWTKWAKIKQRLEINKPRKIWTRTPQPTQ